MNLFGNYKLSKMMSMGDEKVEFVDAAVLLQKMEESGEDPREVQHMKFQMNTIMTVTEDEMVYRMPIPEDVPQDEIEKMTKAGRIVDDMIVLERTKCKIKDGDLYMHDRSTFLAGTEWVKISTDVEGELNLVMAIWTKTE